MPTYSYRCTECENAFDVQQEFTDDSLTVCPTCGGALRKIFGAIGVTFNGSGFYRTDSRKEASTSADSAKSAKATAPAAAAASSTASASSGSTSSASSSSTAAS